MIIKKTVNQNETTHPLYQYEILMSVNDNRVLLRFFTDFFLEKNISKIVFSTKEGISSCDLLKLQFSLLKTVKNNVNKE